MATKASMRSYLSSGGGNVTTSVGKHTFTVADPTFGSGSFETWMTYGGGRSRFHHEPVGPSLAPCDIVAPMALASIVFIVLAIAALLVVTTAHLATRAADLRRKRESAAHAAERSRALVERLGWTAERDPEHAWIWILRGDLAGAAATLAIGCLHPHEWASLTLRGRRWLPEGFEVRGPRGRGPDPLEREPTNFTTDDGTGLVVTPVEQIDAPSSPWRALTRACTGEHLPFVTAEEFSQRTSLVTTADVVEFVRAEAACAAQWADATAAAAQG